MTPVTARAKRTKSDGDESYLNEASFNVFISRGVNRTERRSVIGVSRRVLRPSFFPSALYLLVLAIVSQHRTPIAKHWLHGVYLQQQVVPIAS
jgi:hypothetical protein